MSETIYHALLTGETDKAIKIEWSDKDDTISGWLPKSQIKTWPHQSAPDRLKIEMPDWLFYKKVEELKNAVKTKPMKQAVMDLTPWDEEEVPSPPPPPIYRTPLIVLEPLDAFVFAYVDRVLYGTVRQWTRDCIKHSGYNLIIT